MEQGCHTHGLRGSSSRGLPFSFVCRSSFVVRRSSFLVLIARRSLRNDLSRCRRRLLHHTRHWRAEDLERVVVGRRGLTIGRHEVVDRGLTVGGRLKRKRRRCLRRSRYSKPCLLNRLEDLLPWHAALRIWLREREHRWRWDAGISDVIYIRLRLLDLVRICILERRAWRHASFGAGHWTGVVRHAHRRI